MALPIFRSFMPTVVKWASSAWRQEYRVLVDNNTGAPIGIVSPNANGPDGVWAPTPLSQAQIDAPTATILADLNATYQLNVAPYSRYYSDGTQLLPLSSGSDVVIPPGYNEIYFSPLTITEGHDLIIYGGVRVVA
jgi:hypothetical protein